MAQAPSESIDPRDDPSTPRRPLPVMDVGAFLAGEAGALETLVPEWRMACEDHGLCASSTMAFRNG